MLRESPPALAGGEIEDYEAGTAFIAGVDDVRC